MIDYLRKLEVFGFVVFDWVIVFGLLLLTKKYITDKNLVRDMLPEKLKQYYPDEVSLVHLGVVFIVLGLILDKMLNGEKYLRLSREQLREFGL